MLFGNLIKGATIQGDVRLSVWKDGDEHFVEYFHNVQDMKNEPCRLYAYFKVNYIFCPGDGYLHIELDGESK